LGLSESAAALLRENGYDLLVDLVRAQAGKHAPTKVHELRMLALAKLEMFISDLLREHLGAFEALTSHVTLLEGIREADLRALWEENVTTIGMLVTVDRSRFRFPLERWTKGATLLARASPVPHEIDGLFNREFAPRSMYDVITSTPRYLLGIGPIYARRLRWAGVQTIGALATWPPARLEREIGVTPTLANAFADRAAAALGTTRRAEGETWAMASMRASVSRFRAAAGAGDLVRYGSDVDALARNAAALLEEYVRLVDSELAHRRSPD